MELNNDFELSEKQKDSISIFESFIKNAVTIPEKENILYQYTNIDSLYNGILIKEPTRLKEEICLWASSAEYLNDPNEGATGQKFLEEILSKYLVDTKKENRRDVSDEIEEFFVTSFSTTRDSLPMWSMYGKNGSGIALAFDKEMIEQSSDVSLLRCVYLDDEVKEKIHSFLKTMITKKLSEDEFKILVIISLIGIIVSNEEQRSSVLPYLLFLIYAKDPAYKYENEIRLLFQRENDSKIKYRCQNNLIIPYIENLFPKEALKEIIVGPTNDMKRTIKSLKIYLDHMGFSNVEITPSSIPYRG